MGRSNIEYILQIEKDEFSNFLNRKYMVYEEFRGQNHLRLKMYDYLENKYNFLSMNGFEFTHHDVLSNEEEYEKLKRRYKRLLDIKGNLFIFYHHRYCVETDRKMLLEHLSELQRVYRKRCSKVEIIMFTQIIIGDESKRRVEHYFINGIHVYVFYTLNIWSGKDEDILLARCDDDLLGEMVSEVRKGVKGNRLRSKLDFNLRHKLFGKKVEIF